MSDLLLSMLAGAAGAALFITGFRWRVPMGRKDGLPCPHAMCRNILPRQGALSVHGNIWEDETCPVCGGRVRFFSAKLDPRARDPEDKYIRVHVPELKS